MTNEANLQLPLNPHSQPRKENIITKMTTTAMVPSYGSRNGVIYGLIIKIYNVLKLRLDSQPLDLLVLRLIWREP